MAVNFVDAVSAYEKLARKNTLPGLEARTAKPGGDFAQILHDATQGAVDALRDGERMSLKAAAGTADLNDVVTAVGKANLADGGHPARPRHPGVPGDPAHADLTTPRPVAAVVWRWPQRDMGMAST